MTPKFSVGQAVIHLRTQRRLIVTDRKFNKATKTYAIKVGTNGATYTDVVEMPARWAYRLNDRSVYWFWEELLGEAPQPHKL